MEVNTLLSSVQLLLSWQSVADKPARRAASRWTCCNHKRWTLSV